MDTELKAKIKKSVMDGINLSEEIRDEDISQLIDSEINNSTALYIPLNEKIKIKNEIFNSIRKLDVLSDFLEDDEITEIMINGPRAIFYEKAGRLHRSDAIFEDEERLMSVVQQIVGEANRMVNESVPIVDFILRGSRVNVVLKGVSVDGAAITIRKFPKEIMSMESLIGLGAINERAAQFLGLLVRAGYNIFISGGTGAGKTTFLNALSEYIPSDERVVTIEDSAELKIKSLPNLVRLEARNANVEGKNQISIRDLIKCSLRMRPDRIIVGEVRDSSAVDMLQAMNTGHDGSLSTGHANSAHEMLMRLETMVLMGGVELPLKAIRQQIASAIDVVVHLGRLRDKSRKVLEIREVLGVENEEIVTRELYKFKEDGNEKVVRGELLKINDLINVSKLESAGLIGIYREGKY